MTDTTTGPQTSEAPYAEAGRWYAVITDPHGYVIDLDEAINDPQDDIEDYCAAVVKDTSAPVLQGDGEYRMPGSYDPDDLAHEFRADYTDEFESKWLDALAIAESRNARQVTR